MAERLTRNNKVNFYFHDEASNMVYYKLQKLEDIMDKYGIEDLEQYVEEKRKQDKELRDTIQKLHTIIDTIGYDRDTWQKACELACDDLGLYEDITITQLKMKCYYQQAKKEQDENKN